MASLHTLSFQVSLRGGQLHSAGSTGLQPGQGDLLPPRQTLGGQGAPQAAAIPTALVAKTVTAAGAAVCPQGAEPWGVPGIGHPLPTGS